MHIFLKYLFITLLLVSSLNAAQARGGLLTFTQPDGTQFEGYLKGDSAFHWIESNSQVVLYNAKDKFYYNAKLNASNRLEITEVKPRLKQNKDSLQTAALQKSVSHSVSDASIKQVLRALSAKSREGNHPR